MENFKEISVDEVKKLSEEEQGAYMQALAKHRKDKEVSLAKEIKSLQENEEANASKIEELVKQLNGLAVEDVRGMLKALEIQGRELKAMREKGEITKRSFKKDLKKAFDDKKKDIESFKTKGGSVKMEVSKATQTYGDITDREDLAQVRPGIADQPIRMPKFRSLFRMIPLSTEFYKYMRQATVVRDAQNVAVCTAVTSTTKETLVIEDIGVKKVKDIIKFCLDFVSDYPFMQSRIRKLIEDSLALRVDQQILLGSGAGNELNSIASVSSEFSAANPACVLSLSVQAANLVDLILGMETQVVELGQQNAYTPDYVIVNKCDWFLQVESLKDKNDNYLDTRVVNVNGIPYINGMQVIWSPIVVQNTLYLFDSTKGEIIDRQVLSLEIATENGTDWESEFASLKGFERLNLFVDPTYANAFMKCSDVTTAIAAITKV